MDETTGEIKEVHEKDRVIYAKSFGYSRNIKVLRPITLDKRESEAIKADNLIRSQSKTIITKDGTEIEVRYHYFKSHNTYQLCKKMT